MEDLQDLKQRIKSCESYLADCLKSGDLICQNLPQKEKLNELTTLVGDLFSLNRPYAFRFMKSNAPMCLAIVLVGLGITKYKEGDYWSGVHTDIGIPDYPIWEQKLGKFFLKFLKEKDLPNLDIKGAHKYVTPILYHCGIPNSCLDEYFEMVVEPLVSKELYDPSDEEEIRQDLLFNRKDHKDKVELEHQYVTLKEEIDSIKQNLEDKTKTLTICKKIKELIETEEHDRTDYIRDNRVEDLKERKRELISQVDGLENKMQGLKNEKASLEKIIDQVSLQDEKFISSENEIKYFQEKLPELEKNSEQIHRLRNEEESLLGKIEKISRDIFFDEWDEGYIECISNLSLRKILDKIEYYQHLQVQKEGLKNKIEVLSRKVLFRFHKFWPYLASAFIFTSVITSILLFNSILIPIIFVVFSAGLIFLWNAHHKEQLGKISELKEKYQNLSNEIGETKEEIIQYLHPLSVNEIILNSSSTKLIKDLKNLSDLNKELVQVRLKGEHIQKELNIVWNKFKELKDELSVELNGEIRSQIVNLNHILSEVLKKCERSQEAQAKIEGQILPEIADLEKDIKDLTKKIKNIDNDISDQKASKRVLDYEYILDKQKDELGKEIEDFEQAEQFLKKFLPKGKDIEDLSSQIKELRGEFREKTKKTTQIKEKLSRYPEIYPGIDEPVRRFLFYGGSYAEEFHINSVRLLNEYVDSDSRVEINEGELPERVVSALDDWWRRYKKKSIGIVGVGESHTSRVQRVRTPQIKLDPAMAEVVLSIPTQRLNISQEVDGALLKIVGKDIDTGEKKKQEIPIKLYKVSEEQVETEEFEVPLPFPAVQYKFVLQIGNDDVKHWISPTGFNETTCFLFDSRAETIIMGEEIPKDIYWLVCRRNHIHPENCLIEKGVLYGGFSGFNYMKLDLRHVEILKIGDKEEKKYVFQTSKPEKAEIHLLGGKKTIGALSDGVDVYSQTPSRIKIPFDILDELHNWRLSLITSTTDTSSTVKYYRLSELEKYLEIKEGDGFATIPIQKEFFGVSCFIGTYTIRLRKRPYVDWHTTFCVIPGFEYYFDRKIYLPKEELKDAHVSVITENDFDYLPQPPSKIVTYQEEKTVLKIPQHESMVRGIIEVISDENEGHEIPVSVKIPKLEWKMQGLLGNQHEQWTNQIKEIWLGEMEQLQELYFLVKFPESGCDKCILKLEDDAGINREFKVDGSKGRVDLLPFQDVLVKGPPVQTFTASFNYGEKSFDNIPLFHARVKWEAVEFNVVQKVENNRLVLDLQWKEKGKSGPKKVFLWESGKTVDKPLYEKSVRENETSSRLTFSPDELFPGHYLIQIMKIDLWVSTSVSYPRIKEENVFPIKIEATGDIRQKEVLSVEKVITSDGEKKGIYGFDYKIEIVGKIINRRMPEDVGSGEVLVTSGNEGWFVGKLSVLHRGTVLDSSDINPVKIEYNVSENQLTAIEDRYGDGAMYCEEDCCLLWFEKDIKLVKKKGHTLIGPIEKFIIDRNP